MRKHKYKSNILIDLTSLLDVVFILLLIVLCQLNNNKDKVKLAQQQVDAQTAENEVLQEQYLDQIGKLGDHVTVISVNASFDEKSPETRHISIMNSDQSSNPPEIPELVRMNTDDADKVMKDYIESYINDNPQKVIVLSLNEGDEDILYRDEKRIKSYFKGFRSEHENVRFD